MNNLHRELAPVSDGAWAEIEAEARRTSTGNVASRRLVDLVGPAGPTMHDDVARALHDGEIIWAPAVHDGLLLATRGGDDELHLGQDLSIGYLSHDADHIELHLQESLTFLALTAESSVRLSATGRALHRGGDAR